jgi:hypothetical protein
MAGVRGRGRQHAARSHTVDWAVRLGHHGPGMLEEAKSAPAANLQSTRTLSELTIVQYGAGMD